MHVPIQASAHIYTTYMHLSVYWSVHPYVALHMSQVIPKLCIAHQAMSDSHLGQGVLVFTFHLNLPCDLAMHFSCPS